jgi:hypothetical protein
MGASLLGGKLATLSKRGSRSKKPPDRRTWGCERGAMEGGLAGLAGAM